MSKPLAGTPIGPVFPSVLAAGFDTSRAEGATSTAMPSTTRPPESIGLAAMGRGQVSVS